MSACREASGLLRSGSIMTWYYAENNAQAGPVTEDQLRELVTAGRVKPATLVWKAGMPTWTPLSQAAPQLAGATGAVLATSPAVSGDTALTQRPFGQLMPETALCASCGQFKPLNELVDIAGQRVCAQCKPLALQKLQQGEETGRLNYAGFWIRFAATFMDGIVLLPIILLGYFVFLPKIFTAQPGTQSIGMQASFNLVLLVVQAGYKIFFPGRYGATPGQMIAGLKIVRPDGSPIGYGVAAARFLAEFLSQLILYIGYIMIAFDDQKRALHDRICNTRVIRK